MRNTNQLAKPRQLQVANESALDGASIRYLPSRNFKAEIQDALGPDPEMALRCFVDLGLSDSEIAKYVELSSHYVRLLALPIRAENDLEDAS